MNHKHHTSQHLKCVISNHYTTWQEKTTHSNLRGNQNVKYIWSKFKPNTFNFLWFFLENSIFFVYIFKIWGRTIFILIQMETYDPVKKMFMNSIFYSCLWKFRREINFKYILILRWDYFFSPTITRYVLEIRGVQNRINLIKKLQFKSIQIKIAKDRIWFGCIQIICLLNHMVWFSLRFLFY